MFKTIKLNKGYWQKKIPQLKYGVPDPLKIFSPNQAEFSEALTSFNFSGVFKTTKAGRHKQTQLFLKEQLNGFATAVSILDIGASDGSTSLDLVNLLQDGFSKYYVTDYNIRCTYVSYKGYTYFFNESNDCFLAVSQKFVCYPANRNLFNFLFGRQLAAVKDQPRQELLLINKDLQKKQQADQRIELMAYNVFEPWLKGKMDIVIAANLLNRAYFSDAQIELALRNCYAALNENGILVIIRNKLTDEGDEIEKSTLYKKDTVAGELIKIHEINEGIEINSFVRSLKF